MALVKLLKNDFSAQIRDRGDSYFRRGRVVVSRANKKSLDARVKGTRTYDVRLETDDDRILGWCTCPYYKSGKPCKHLWAAIREADDRKAVRLHTEDAGLDIWDIEPMNPAKPPKAKPAKSARKRATDMPHWESLLLPVRRADPPLPRPVSRDAQHMAYLIDVDNTSKAGTNVCVRLQTWWRKKNGAWGKPKVCRVGRNDVDKLPDHLDRRIFVMLMGARVEHYYHYGYTYETASDTFGVPEALLDDILPLLFETGRCRLIMDTEQHSAPLVYDQGPPWQLALDVQQPKKSYLVTGQLVRGDTTRNLSSPVLLLASGWVFWPGEVARLDAGGSFAWINALRKHGSVAIPSADGPRFTAALLAHPQAPRLTLPDDLQFDRAIAETTPKFVMFKPTEPTRSPPLPAELRFVGHNREWAYADDENGWFDEEHGVAMARNAEFEARAAHRVLELGCIPSDTRQDGRIGVPAHIVSTIVRTLIDEGWMVEGEGVKYRKAAAFHIDVTSNIDWFEVKGSCDFDGVSMKLPALLRAARKGGDTIELGDGSQGILPEEWMRTFALLGTMGSPKDDRCTFHRAQAGVLDLLLDAAPSVNWDDESRRVRKELSNFDAVKAEQEPSLFKGTLRPYQREGLGWLLFLQRFGFGGCLADDMGLGKTVQVLALLSRTRAIDETHAASLVVVPRSLIFNWIDEAKRFVPHLRILDHTGIARNRGTDGFKDCDLVLTTYGTLTRDILELKEYTFDYVILDEAQAIKNNSTKAAKATRLLRARHRLALSGTPIENHLGELWSLFEFLNPGMLGASAAFDRAFRQVENEDQPRHDLLARVVRPFILRRKKAQVAKDLPEKLEETLYCELERTERKRYDELRDHFRASLLSRLDKNGMNKSKMHILEALLRLRQAACHPGLIDKTKVNQGSAKLDTLLFQLEELLEEGHKVLVFSQFTSFLAIVRKRLDKQQVDYAYIDGRVRKRKEQVERFQTDPDCKLFLISLKAGGLGLNLTAAEYVFLLDPWWNPAVEAQAIDRAHRIGQTRKVFAYRIIAKDTVEEKVLELQKSKRDLADAIIGENNSLIRDITREDIELLLS